MIADAGAAKIGTGVVAGVDVNVGVAVGLTAVGKYFKTVPPNPTEYMSESFNPHIVVKFFVVFESWIVQSEPS